MGRLIQLVLTFGTVLCLGFSGCKPVDSASLHYAQWTKEQNSLKQIYVWLANHARNNDNDREMKDIQSVILHELQLLSMAKIDVQIALDRSTFYAGQDWRHKLREGDNDDIIGIYLSEIEQPVPVAWLLSAEGYLTRCSIDATRFRALSIKLKGGSILSRDDVFKNTP